MKTQQPALLLGMTDHFLTQDDCTTVCAWPCRVAQYFCVSQLRRPALRARWSIATFWVGWQSFYWWVDWALWTNTLAWCLSKEEVYRSNVRTDDDLEQRIQDTLATVYRDFLRKCVEYVCHVAEAWQMLGDMCSTLRESGRVWLYDVARNVAIRYSVWRMRSFNLMCLLLLCLFWSHSVLKTDSACCADTPVGIRPTYRPVQCSLFTPQAHCSVMTTAGRLHGNSILSFLEAEAAWSCS